MRDRRSLHTRIAADLRDEILSGGLPAGGNIPSTQQLTDRFSASNATVQKALQILKDEGLVVGRPGSGVLVREHRQRTMYPASYLAPAAPGQPYRWITEAGKRGVRARSRLLDVAEVRPPSDVAVALNITDGGTALLRSQVLLFDDEPVELVKSFYPPDIVRGTAMTERRRIRGGTPTLLAELGYPPRKCVDRVAARVPTQEQYEALALPTDLPVLRTFRVVYSDDERPIEASVMAKAGHLYELRYDISV
ncbi:GntR family transcriptional regulator [Streptomyces sp. AV19]|uniref:GntR family transcriptional regulator n=1 Tax=Streptomyces sp. AV19 TaxID=2793068 RepID=UPI002413B0D2|nr:GntR family transcriptional regulator [Streptomyces sp. AV19]MDG4530775.1 GntR family transcriptional regulator [Streptomyces sp. AV19]